MSLIGDVLSVTDLELGGLLPEQNVVLVAVCLAADVASEQLRRHRVLQRRPEVVDLLTRQTPPVAHHLSTTTAQYAHSAPAPPAQATRRVLAPTVVLDRTQPIARCRSVSMLTALQRGCCGSVTPT